MKSRESGTLLEVVSQSLGHANIGITSKIYVRVNDQAMADKAERLEGILGPIFRRSHPQNGKFRKLGAD